MVSIAMVNMGLRTLLMEAFDTIAVVDFLTSNPVRVQIERLSSDRINVCITACDDRSTILLDQNFEIPPGLE